MEKFVIDNYPFKKQIFLSWYEAAIGHLLLFKHLKEKYSNNVYFLISQQGIIMKATTQQNLRNVDDQVNRFYSAKIQQLQISASADFYQHIIEDIKDQTERLKDSRDCPYINLVYSEKIKLSCLAMKKYGYLKPYQGWQCKQRQKRGFCFLIVRPQHRWKQIASNVLGLVKKRQSYHLKGSQQTTWPIDLPYQKFIWFYLKKQFKNYGKSIDLKQKKSQNLLTIIIKNDLPSLNQLQKQIDSLHFGYYSEQPLIQEKLKGKVIIISSLQLEKITQLIYHQFGLTGLVKQLRKKGSKYLIIGSVDLSLAFKQKTTIVGELESRADVRKISESDTYTIFKLGRRHTIVSYQGMNFVLVKFQKPLCSNIISTIKYKLPFLPKYYYWYQKDQKIYMLRHYYPKTILQALQQSNNTQQLNYLYSFFACLQHLHSKQIFIGRNIAVNVYVDEKRVIFETGQIGSKMEDLGKCLQLLNQWGIVLKDQQIAKKILQCYRQNDNRQIIKFLENQLKIF